MTLETSRWLGRLVSVCAVALATQAGAGGSLSGSYSGATRCAADGAARAATAPRDLSTLLLSELADGSVAARIDGVGYRGHVSGGEGELVRCGALQNAYGDEGATLPLRIVGEQIQIGGAFGRVGSCQASWTRVSAADPGLRACE
ncbi:MAG TPA: hypothetical protein VMR50_17050 [Myxococcota bacterium]|nr:hypothetical protein [Myxococcota bacterium]